MIWDGVVVWFCGCGALVTASCSKSLQLCSFSCRHDRPDYGVLPLPAGDRLPHYHPGSVQREPDPPSDAVEHVVSFSCTLTWIAHPKIELTVSIRGWICSCKKFPFTSSSTEKYFWYSPFCWLWWHNSKLCSCPFRPFWLMIILAVLFQHLVGRFCFIKKIAGTRDLDNRWRTCGSLLALTFTAFTAK